MTASRIEQIRIVRRLRRLLAARARLDGADPEQRATWRAARLGELRRHATDGSPLYRELHRDLDDAPLEALPTVTKDDVVERFDDMVTDRSLRIDHLREVVSGGGRRGKALGRYRVAMSSGSSGRPGLFAFDEAEWTSLIANAARARSLAGSPPGSGRIRSAKIGSPSGWHLSRQLPATLRDPRKPALDLSAAADVPELVDELQRWQPDILTGYPSTLAALADEQMGGRLQITPARVFVGGERLTRSMRDRIASAWGADPFDQYLTTEAGFVAIECAAHAGLHVLDDHVIVEVVDAAGEAVAPGTYGHKVLVTVLSSRTLPLIRYELGDVAALAEGACACGRRSPRLMGIESAPRELLTLPAKAGGQVTVHPVVVTAVLDAAPLRAWQVAHDRQRLNVLVVGPDSSFDPASVVEQLTTALVAAGVDQPVVEVSIVDSLERSASGKAALVVSERAAPSPPAP